MFNAYNRLLILFSSVTLFILPFLEKSALVVLGSVGIIIVVFAFVVVVIVVIVVVIVIIPTISSGMTKSFAGFAKGFAKVSVIIGGVAFLFAILAEGSHVASIGNPFSEWLLIGRCNVGALALDEENCTFVTSILLAVVFIL